MLAPLLGAALAQDPPKYEVTGFRDIRFGMTEQDVRTLASKVFDLKQV